MNVQELKTPELLARIAELQQIQKTHSSKTPAWRTASELLAPCFAEMARRAPAVGSPEHVAKKFGCTAEQARAQMLRNADALRKMTDKQVKRAGYTRSDLNEKAAGYETRARTE